MVISGSLCSALCCEHMLQLSTNWLMWTDSPLHKTDCQALGPHLTIPWCPLWKSLRISCLMQWGMTILWPLRSSSAANTRISLSGLYLAVFDEFCTDQLSFLFFLDYIQSCICHWKALNTLTSVSNVFFILCEYVFNRGSWYGICCSCLKCELHQPQPKSQHSGRKLI